ncbi:MAG: hypothetical protein ACPL4E_00895 [Thermoproteota archaeon]
MNEIDWSVNCSDPGVEARFLAHAFDYIDFLDKDKGLITRIDIGMDEARRHTRLGWSGNEKKWDAVENFAWDAPSLKYCRINGYED